MRTGFVCKTELVSIRHALDVAVAFDEEELGRRDSNDFAQGEVRLFQKFSNGDADIRFLQVAPAGLFLAGNLNHAWR